MSAQFDRRKFIGGATTLAAGTLLARPAQAEGSKPSMARPDLSTWAGIRGLFKLSPDYIHMAGLLLASHPTPVREAIDRYRQELDENPVHAIEHGLSKHDDAVFKAAEAYIKAKPGSVALTDSTTMGLGLVYSSIKVNRGEELIDTENCHYSTREALRMKAERSGATHKTVRLYAEGHRATIPEILKNLEASITPRTRLVAVTWVHSSTGVKLPVGKIADRIKALNKKRKRPILLSVDGVHGFGVDNITMADFRSDFFIAGTHKWMFGPRGTGLVWGSDRGWASIDASIPPFDWPTFVAWMQNKPTTTQPPGRRMTPGGFHSFEHRWAVKEAFELHQAIGKARVEKRIHEHAKHVKTGLKAMKHVTLHTPMDDELSAGIICFEVAGMKPPQVIEALGKKKIIASTTPYSRSFARLTPGLFNTPQEIDKVLSEIKALA